MSDLTKRLRDLEDENARLKKQLDRQGEKYAKLVEILFGDLKHGEESAARIAELEAALQPFAEVATRLGWDKLDDDSPVLEEHIIDAPADDIAPGAFYCLMVQPFREASVAIQTKAEK